MFDLYHSISKEIAFNFSSTLPDEEMVIALDLYLNTAGKVLAIPFFPEALIAEISSEAHANGSL